MAISIVMTRSRTGSFALTVTKRDGVTPIDLTGKTLAFHGRVGGIAIDKDTTDGILVTNAPLGLAQLQITPADTAGVPITGTYGGDCELTDVDGADEWELDRGTITIYPNVGTP